MFGYVRPWTAELKVREYETYRALYCGLCRAMKKETGWLSSFSLSYDMVFLAMARMLYGDRTMKRVRRRCAAHPVKPHLEIADSEPLREAARLSAVLVAAKNRDDLSDERGMKRLRARLLSPLLSHAEKRARARGLAKRIAEILRELSAIEKQNLPSVDAPADASGRLLGEVFAFGIEGETPLYRLGELIGRVVYKLDALDDYDEDVRCDRYNPYRALYGDTGFTDEFRSNAKNAVKHDLIALEGVVLSLPFGECDEIEALMKNILYLGLTARLDRKGKKDDRSL